MPRDAHRPELRGRFPYVVGLGAPSPGAAGGAPLHGACLPPPASAPVLAGRPRVRAATARRLPRRPHAYRSTRAPRCWPRLRPTRLEREGDTRVPRRLRTEAAVAND